MENKENSPFLTATYQNIFILDLRQINECFFQGDYEGSFEALRILYSDLLEKPRSEIEKDWQQFLTEKNQIVTHGELQHRRLMNQQRSVNSFLYQNIPVIKAKFIRALEKHNLLNIDFGAKPQIKHKKMASF